MSNVTICRPSDITSSLTEYLTRKVVSKADIVNYKKQWKLSDIDFSITETSLDFVCIASSLHTFSSMLTSMWPPFISSTNGLHLGLASFKIFFSIILYPVIYIDPSKKKKSLCLTAR